MKEDFIHFLWKFRLFTTNEPVTACGMSIKIEHTGIHNQDAGPDFSAAKIIIDGTLWVGNVEMHLRSSDWFRHKHQHDPAYGNIILHVVMEHDADIYDARGNVVPVFEIRNFFDAALMHKYESILQSKSWVPCERFIHQSDSFIVMNWLNRLVVERLERKAAEIVQFYNYFERNWEQTFYYFLARNFGFKLNASPFALLSQQTNYRIIARHRDDLTQLEALFFGQAGLLEDDFKDAYPTLLKKEYAFLRHKYKLTPIDGSLWKFGKMRPKNFPTIRIAQFARLMHHSVNLFGQITEKSSRSDIKELFKAQSTPYWNNHYRFDISSNASKKNLGTLAIDNIIINTIVPLKFVYGKEILRHDISEQAIQLLAATPAENNQIIRNWIKISIKPENASDSQALLELKKHYCTPKKCLHCAIGNHLVRKH